MQGKTSRRLAIMKENRHDKVPERRKKKKAEEWPRRWEVMEKRRRKEGKK